MKMKMIVTGSAGFIGKALCQELRKRAVEVIEIDRVTGQEAQRKPVYSMMIWCRSGKITLILL